MLTPNYLMMTMKQLKDVLKGSKQKTLINRGIFATRLTLQVFILVHSCYNNRIIIIIFYYRIYQP